VRGGRPAPAEGSAQVGNAAELRNEWPGVKRVRRERERERERESGREIASSRASLNAARQYSGEARRDSPACLALMD